jgi:curli production assembly/transport component CsgF
MKSMKSYVVLLTVFCPIASGVLAGDLVYRPVNPNFGGDPFNANHLQSMAASQNTQKPEPRSSSSTQQTASQRFISMLQSRLYSSLASQVANAIFGEDAQESGTVEFDDQQVSFVNTGTEIQLTITDFVTGNVTNIRVPVVAE